MEEEEIKFVPCFNIPLLVWTQTKEKPCTPSVTADDINNTQTKLEVICITEEANLLYK
jgi:hypothetical protein